MWAAITISALDSLGPDFYGAFALRIEDGGGGVEQTAVAREVLICLLLVYSFVEKFSLLVVINWLGLGCCWLLASGLCCCGCKNTNKLELVAESVICF